MHSYWDTWRLGMGDGSLANSFKEEIVLVRKIIRFLIVMFNCFFHVQFFKRTLPFCASMG